MSKEDEKSFFGMTLNTFRVSHVTGLEKHINALLVDHKGFFRGHIDSYSEKIEKDNKEYNRILKFTGDTEWSSSLFQYAIYINVLNQWTFELLPSGELNGLEFSNIMIERMNELERIYSSVPDNPIIYVGNTVNQAMIKRKQLMVFTFNGNQCPDSKQTMLLKIGEFFLDMNLNPQDLMFYRKNFSIVLKIIEQTEVVDEDFNYLRRILIDRTLHVKTPSTFPDMMYKIIGMVTNAYEIAPLVLIPIFKGENSIIEILNSNSLDIYKDILDLVDYLNRRYLVKAN